MMPLSMCHLPSHLDSLGQRHQAGLRAEQVDLEGGLERVGDALTVVVPVELRPEQLRSTFVDANAIDQVSRLPGRRFTVDDCLIEQIPTTALQVG